MDAWVTILIAAGSVYGAMALGAGCRRWGLIKPEGDRTLLRLIVQVGFPCLILHVIVGNPALREGQNVWAPPLAGFVSVCVGYAVGMLAGGLMGRAMGLEDPRARRTFAVCVGLFNYGYIPYPLVEQLYREPEEMRRTMGVLVVHNMGVEVAMWSVGVLLMSGTLGRGWWRRVLNPPVLAILGAWGCNLVGLDRRHPALSPVFAALELVGQIAIPLGLLLVGASLADQWSPRVLGSGRRTSLAGCVLRLGVLPAMALGAVTVCRGASVELQRVMVIQAAMPAALFPIVLARLYGGDTLVALRVVLATSLVSTVTTPLWLPLGLSLVRG